jgi:hypothetical protein
MSKLQKNFETELGASKINSSIFIKKKPNLDFRIGLLKKSCKTQDFSINKTNLLIHIIVLAILLYPQHESHHLIDSHQD